MPFEKCLRCPAIKERRCAGPNYMAMPTKDLVAWGIEYQRINGITNAKLAEVSGVPKGTIDGLKYRTDVRHDTIYKLIQSLIEMTGGSWIGEHCTAAASDAGIGTAHLEAENKRLESELERANRLITQQEQAVSHYRQDMRKRDTIIFSLLGLLGLCLCLMLL